MNKYCPQCGDLHQYSHEEDFCPIHQTRLVSKTEAAEEGNNLLDRLKKTFSVGKKSRDSGETVTDSKETILPQKLIDLGWGLVSSLPVQTTGDADFFNVTNSDGTVAVFKRYRGGSDTAPAIYETIEELKSKRMAPLLFSDNVKTSGTEFDSELLLIDGLQSYKQYLFDNPSMGEAGVKWFLTEALEILKALSEYELSCLQFTPCSLLITAKKELLLQDFSQVFSDEPEDRFVPGIRNLAIEYAAPEIVNKRIMTVSKSVMFSVGAIAAEMAWGYIPNQIAIMKGNVDFAALPQEIVAPLMGLLYPDTDQRWDKEDLSQWLDGETVPIPDWSRLDPRANEKALVINAQTIYLPEDLSALIYSDIDTAVNRLDDILDWIIENPRTRDRAFEIRRHQAANANQEWLALRLAFLLNQEQPKAWRGISFDGEVVTANLVELSRRAVGGDKESMSLLNKLYELELNDVFAGGEK